VTNQLQTSAGAPVTQSGITMADSIHIGTPNDLGISNTNTGSHPTDSSGNFPDTYFVFNSLPRKRDQRCNTIVDL
jgi:hypothetical protein